MSTVRAPSDRAPETRLTHHSPIRVDVDRRAIYRFNMHREASTPFQVTLATGLYLAAALGAMALSACGSDQPASPSDTSGTQDVGGAAGMANAGGSADVGAAGSDVSMGIPLPM